MMPRAAIRIGVVAALAVLALIGTVVWESVLRDRGTEVVFPMAGVDPRSLLSGNFVAISLQGPLAGPTCPPGFDTSEIYNGPLPQRWIAFSPAGAHDAIGATVDRAAAMRLSPIVARGTASCVAPSPAADGEPATPGSITLDLGVNRFYASQDEAQAITGMTTACQPSGGCATAAILSIGQDGRARLKGLMIAGKRFEMTAF
jgi:hypothetical protein